MKPPSPNSSTGSSNPLESTETSKSEGAEPLLSSGHNFVSRVSEPVSLEQQIAGIEVILARLGLPKLDEFNRLEMEAEARRAKKKRKPAADRPGSDSPK